SGVITTPQVNAQCAPLATRRQALVVKVASYEAMRTRVQGRVDYYNQLLLGQVNERQAMERTRDGYVRQVASIDAAINSMRGRVQGIDTQRQSLSCP
ncbi:MAG: hypothetical protein HYS98_08010, partial [Deltaproteobacteria bacterium]|nr:hypothetical protein [Deltaproteobacteria bacterium]